MSGGAFLPLLFYDEQVANKKKKKKKKEKEKEKGRKKKKKKALLVLQHAATQ